MRSEYLENIIRNRNSICDMQIVCIDIVKYSKRKTSRQVSLINSFTSLVNKALNETHKKYFEILRDNKIDLVRDSIIIPTGDGIIFGIPINYICNLHLELSLNVLKEIFEIKKNYSCPLLNSNDFCNCHDYFDIRIGIGLGQVILYIDINKSYNIAGTPLNITARVMNYGDSNRIFFTEPAYKQFDEISNTEHIFQKYDNLKIKHGYINAYQYQNSNIEYLNSQPIKIIKDYSDEELEENIIKNNSKIEIPINENKKSINQIKKNDKSYKRDNDVLSPQMILVEAKDFRMGNDKFGLLNVHLTKDFFISKYLVTQELFEYIMGYNNSHFKGSMRPIESINWLDAIRFCNKLSERFGFSKYYNINNDEVAFNFSSKGYRLLTEAEWEFVCIKGLSVINRKTLEKAAWFSLNSQRETHEVGRKIPNDLGVFDLLGNVWEWCFDDYGEYKQNTGILENRIYSEGKSRKVVRGGSFASTSNILNPKHRDKRNYKYTSNDLGFRIARDN